MRGPGSLPVARLVWTIRDSASPMVVDYWNR